MSVGTGSRHQRPTLERVAAHAGVSRATVSRVVNGSTKVSPEVRTVVEASIRALRYVPNRAARTLVTQRTDAIAVVAAELETMVFSDPYFARIVRGASRVLADEGYQMVLLMVHDRHDYERIEAYLAAGHVDGVLLVSAHRRDPLLKTLPELGVPLVMVGRPFDRAAVPYYADVDNRQAAAEAVRYLQGRGRRHIAHIAGPQDMMAGVDRRAGYRDALGADYDERLVVEGDFTVVSGIDTTNDLLDRGLPVDAIFAASDLMAAGALRALRAQGLRVPDDIAVVGFDDHPGRAEWELPPLTTVHQPVGHTGEAIARLLIAQLRGEPTIEPVILPAHLVIRESA